MNGITLRELEMLIYIYQQPRTVIELANFLDVSEKTINVYARRLRKKELIETERKANSIHCLSEKGLNIIIGLREKIKRNSKGEN